MRHVLVADDHAVARRGLQDVVTELWPTAQVEAVDSGDAVLQLLDRHPWDLALLDVLMPGPGIVALIGAVRARWPHSPVLVLTASNEPSYVVESIRAGASGVVFKHDADEELMLAMRRVAAGGQYVNAEAALALAVALRQGPDERPHLALSARELTVFRGLAQGRAIKEIAFELGLSSKTVTTYLARIRTKTGLSTPVDIARYAVRHGLVD